MFFVRTTLVLGLGVLLMPTDHDSQARVYAGAKSAVAWTVTFCERNPAACVKGHEAWDVFVKKAEFGARMAVDLINSRDDAKPAQTAASQPQPTMAPAALRSPHGAAPRRAAGTLQSTDLEPAWRGKLIRTGG